MYDTGTALVRAESQALDIILEERRRFFPALRIIENYAAENRMVVTGWMASAMVRGAKADSLPHQDYANRIDLYSAHPQKDAKAIADAIWMAGVQKMDRGSKFLNQIGHETSPDSRSGILLTYLSASAMNPQFFTVKLDGRAIAHIHGFPDHRGVDLFALVLETASMYPGVFSGMVLACENVETRLSVVYAGLCDVTMDWGQLANDEMFLRKVAFPKTKTGSEDAGLAQQLYEAELPNMSLAKWRMGDKRKQHKAKNHSSARVREADEHAKRAPSLAKSLLELVRFAGDPTRQRVLVGAHAVWRLDRSTKDRVRGYFQIVSPRPFSEDLETIKAILSEFVPVGQIGHTEDRLKHPTDSRIARLSIKINKETAIIVYNISQNELVPFVTKEVGGAPVAIGDPCVLARVCLADRWTMRVIGTMGLVTPDYRDIVLRQYDDLYRAIGTLIDDGLRAPQTPEAYSGYYVDLQLATKREARDKKNKHFIPAYYPAARDSV